MAEIECSNDGRRRRAPAKPAKDKSRVTQLRRTAYHEAGHAVIGRVLTLTCGSASIEPDYDDGSWGRSICPDPWACISEWEKRGKVRQTRSAWVARTIQSMAGAEAEIEFLGTKLEDIGDGDDRYQITLMLDEVAPADLERHEARLRKMTRMLVRRHRVRIERVAQALLAKTTLASEELDRLVGRSVADVKVNAPFLIEMHRR
jgi:hypothetical protein